MKISHLFQHIKDRIKGKIPAGSKRSNQWPAVRKAHLAKNTNCALCGGNKKLEVHHINPFHLHPALELEPTNLITLCEAKKVGINCHLAFGHLGNFRSFNVSVTKDSKEWNDRIMGRPKTGDSA